VTPDENLDGDWSVTLDPDPRESDVVDVRGRVERAPRGKTSLSRGCGAAGLLVLVLAATLVVWRPEAPPPGRRPSSSVLGRGLAAPVLLRLPTGAVTTADAGYVGIQLPGEGSVIVTVPTQVVNPDGPASARRPLPADPAAWLERHPEVFVSRVRTVAVGGSRATQIDYRRSRSAVPQSQFAALSLFCGPPCTRITSAARVRATFVPVGGRTVLVEAVWRADAADPDWPMPAGLRASYTKLLTGLRETGLREGSPGPGRPSPSS
jgi:hypothetical protein